MPTVFISRDILRVIFFGVTITKTICLAAVLRFLHDSMAQALSLGLCISITLKMTPTDLQCTSSCWLPWNQISAKPSATTVWLSWSYQANGHTKQITDYVICVTIIKHVMFEGGQQSVSFLDFSGSVLSQWKTSMMITQLWFGYWLCAIMQ